MINILSFFSKIENSPNLLYQVPANYLITVMTTNIKHHNTVQTHMPPHTHVHTHTHTWTKKLKSDKPNLGWKYKIISEND